MLVSDVVAKLLSIENGDPHADVKVERLLREALLSQTKLDELQLEGLLKMEDEEALAGGSLLGKQPIR